MPPKKNPETPKQQAARFKREVERMIAAGELDPDAGAEALDTLVRRAATKGDSHKGE